MVDKDILKVNQERGGNQKGNETTLFDYISDQEIIELQRQADDQIGEIEASWCSTHASFLKISTFFFYCRRYIIHCKIKSKV
jgi:hypothetical protein